jgi:gas vesicle protein
MSNKGKFALLVGLAAGVATGVLFSPTSGKKFRTKLKKEIDKGGLGKESLFTYFKGLANEIKTTADKKLTDAKVTKSKITDKVSKVKKSATKKATKAKKTVTAKAKKAKTVVKKSKKIAKEAVAEIAQEVKNLAD